MARTRFGPVPLGLRAPERPFFDAALAGFLAFKPRGIFAFFITCDLSGLNGANYSIGELARKSASLPNALARWL